jgi:hypothetical protein
MIIVKAPAPNPHYPPKWHDLDKYLGHPFSAENVGFPVATGDLNRFASRYRLARSFKAISLADYTQSTVSGYGALFRVFLVWSAFELFLPVVGCTQQASDGLIAPYDPKLVASKIVSLDPERRFYGFIYKRANIRHRAHVKACFTGASFNPTYLASAIRHIFAHGYLSPSVGEADPEAVCGICSALCDFLFQVMDTEFEKRANDFLAQL